MASFDQYYKKHEEFRIDEKYVDVTVKCEDKEFKCHRNILAAACDFFDRMFSSNFRESTEDYITLPEISAETFKDILRHIYVGDLTIIDSSNVYRLLQASEFFGFPNIEDECLKFVKENRMAVGNTFDVFVFACATKKNEFIEILVADIVEQFRIFSRSSKFLEISIDDLNVILDHWLSSASQNDELYFGAVVRWVFHDRENRLKHLDRFFGLFRFENLKSQYVKFVVGKLLMIKESDYAVLSQVFKCAICYDDIPQVPRKTLKKTEKSLHVYVKYEQEKLIRIFSINSSEQCTITGEIPLIATNHTIRTLALDDFYLYSLHSEIDDSSDHLFNVQTSADMRSPLSLTSPPVIFKGIRWASLQNNIYVYNQMLSERRSTTHPSKGQPATNIPYAAFTAEEISRGIYVYNCDLDCWFPMPAMKYRVQNGCLIAHKDKLYLIGGHYPGKQSNTFGSPSPVTNPMQMYDYRVGIWQERAALPFSLTSGDCCIFLDDIYILGGSDPRVSVSRYDVKANTWDYTQQSLVRELSNESHVITYSYKMWLMGGVPPDGLRVQTSSLSRGGVLSWNVSSVITNTMPNYNSNSTNNSVMDCVIFRSL